MVISFSYGNCKDGCFFVVFLKNFSSYSLFYMFLLLLNFKVFVQVKHDEKLSVMIGRVSAFTRTFQK